MNRSTRTIQPAVFSLLSALALIVGPAVASTQPVGSEFQVNTYTTSSQHGAAVAKDGSGGFVAVWGSDQNGDPDIFGQRYDSQRNPVGSEFQVNTYGGSGASTGAQRSPALAVDTSGAFVVVWEGSKPSDPDGGLFGQRYDSSGNALGAEFRVNTTTSSLQSSAALAFYGSGDLVVVWQSPDGNGLGIFGQRYDAAGKRAGTEFRINMRTEGNQNSPSVTSDGRGNVIVVWSCFQCDYYRLIRGRRYDSSGRPLGHEFAIDFSTHGGRTNSDDPDVAADAQGNFVVVWGGNEASYYNGIYGRRFDSAGLSLGGFTVDITDYAPPCYTCKDAPSVAYDADGNFIVVWHDKLRESSGSGVFGRAFDAAGKAGSIFQVNTYTTGNQKPAPSGAITSDPLGDFIVVWQSDGQDGSGYGVFGQQLVGPVPPQQPPTDAAAKRRVN